MITISPAIADFKLLGGFTGDTKIHLRGQKPVSFKDLAQSPDKVERVYTMNQLVVPTLIGMTRLLGYTSIIEIGISNLFKLRVGRKQAFYSADGIVLLADQLQRGDELVGMTPDMFRHADAGSELVYSYLSSAYFRVTSIDETADVEAVYSATSPKHNSFVLANGLLVRAVPRIIQD